MNITITSPRLKDIAIDQLEKALGRQVRIGELKVNLWRGLELKELSVENHEDFPTGTFAQVETLIVRYRLLPLLQRKFIIGNVFLTNPRILLERDEEGEWNFSDFLTARNEAAVSENSTSSKKISLLISRVTINGGEIILRDGKTSQPPLETKLDTLDFTISNFSLLAPFRFQLTGTLRGTEPATFSLQGKVNLLQLAKLEANLTVNDLAFSIFQPYLEGYVPFTNLTGKSTFTINCQMDKEKNLYLTGKVEGKDIGLKFLSPSSAAEFPLEKIDKVYLSLNFNLTGKAAQPPEIGRLEGNLNLDRGEIKLSRLEIPLTNIKGKLETDGNKVSFSELRANLGEGTMGLQGEITSIRNFISKGADNEKEDSLKISPLSYSFQVDWQNIDLNDLLPPKKINKDMLSGKLEGQAFLEGKELSPEALSGQGKLRIKEGKLVGMPLFQLLVSLLEMPFLAEIDFEEISTDFFLENKTVTTDNLKLLSRDITMFAKGSFDFETNLDYQLIIGLSPEISADSSLQLLYPQNEKGWLIIKTPLTGTFKKPKLNLLKAPVERIIKKGFEDIIQKIFGE